MRVNQEHEAKYAIAFHLSIGFYRFHEYDANKRSCNLRIFSRNGGGDSTVAHYVTSTVSILHPHDIIFVSLNVICNDYLQVSFLMSLKTRRKQPQCYFTVLA